MDVELDDDDRSAVTLRADAIVAEIQSNECRMAVE